MSSEQAFAWNEWYKNFSLTPDSLAEVRAWYPEILAARQQSQHPFPAKSVALNQQFIQALVETESASSNLLEYLNYYLERGELGAATVLLQSISDDDLESNSLQRQVDHRLAELESSFARLKAQLKQYHDDLVRLGNLPQPDPDFEQMNELVEGLFQQKRLGLAIHLLQEHVRSFESWLKAQQQQMATEITRLRQEAKQEIQPELQLALERLLDRAETFINNHMTPLAERAIQDARTIIATKDLSDLLEQSHEPENVILREEFPDVRTEEILAWLKGRAISDNKHIKTFFEKWCPREWTLRSKIPSKGDATYRIFETLDDLNRLKGASYPFSEGDADRWKFFLRDLFDLLGKRLREPRYAEAITTRQSDKRKEVSGFWLGKCSQDLSIPHTFLDPERLRDGLALVLWHNPNNPLCPKPANLVNELKRRGLTERRLVFIAGEIITPEDRKALYQAIPTAALLDERDLLQIIFCSDQPEVRAMHFARIISRQLPPDQASPFIVQGEVASSMFVGRQDVLRKLLAPDGPTILYGGRKLGKSSIFRQLERSFEKQDGRRGKNIPIYYNAINVVDGAGIKRFLLPDVIQSLNHALINRGYKGEVDSLEVHIRSEVGVDGDEFANHIRKLLRILPEHRFLLLIDESDSLLQYLNVSNDPLLDPSERFGWTLRGLIQESGGRFDVRFAGFQEISQVPKLTSGPFYNFRPGKEQAYPLSFLETEEAAELIVRPLQLLGVMFTDKSLVDLILEYSGQHPALIQKFCMLLYERVRSSRKDYKNLLVSEEDVDTVWKNQEFRKEVVRSVLLNVQTRDTKPEKILRLLLYLWVQKIMAPDDFEIPVVADSNHLYQLLCQVLMGGEDAVREQQITKSRLSDYLSDLKTLGVLREHGRGYVFHYRYFARLLYYDHFQGQLDKREIDNVWQTIVQHKDEVPRMHIRIGQKLSMSPFNKKDQEQLEKERAYLAFVLGAPGTGKTEFFNWLKMNQETPNTHLIQATNLSFDQLRGQLSLVFGLNPDPDNWQTFADQAVARWTGDVESTLIVLDDVDNLIRDKSLSLLWWPSTDKIEEDEGLLYTLARLTRNSKGKLRFAITGTFPLARFWVECEEFLSELGAHFVTQQLKEGELGKWCDVARLVALNEVKQHIWNITGGDWRLLSTLQNWLAQRKIEEPSIVDIAQFQQALKSSLSAETFPELYRTLNNYDPIARETLKGLASISREWGHELEESICAELLSDYFAKAVDSKQSKWTQPQWLIELRTAILLQELKRQPVEGSQRDNLIIIPLKETWFQLLTNTYA